MVVLVLRIGAWLDRGARCRAAAGYPLPPRASSARTESGSGSVRAPRTAAALPGEPRQDPRSVLEAQVLRQVVRIEPGRLQGVFPPAQVAAGRPTQVDGQVRRSSDLRRHEQE